MRPVSLTMKAFGSFAKETKVPFEDFPSGLYLVVGETGAGKTTIFDAIVFALFGTASGTNRKPEMMHSDYVDKSEDTEVCLVFDHGGKRYTVTRTIHFSKKRGTENKYGDGKPSANLILPEGQPVRGHESVTKRCEELLGLNADQFRKIVMLAQGEFREFLASPSDKKSEILGKLFDSSEYVRYQILLGNAKAALNEKRKQYQDSVDTVMTTVFQMPEEEDDIFLYHATNPQLIENLDQLIERGKEKTAILLKRKNTAQDTVNNLNTRKGAAEGNNQRIKDLSDAQEHKEELNAQHDEMERLSRQYAQAEKALHRVRPVQAKWFAAKETVEQANKDIRSLNDSILKLKMQYEQAKTDVDSDADAEKRINEIDDECRRIIESLPAYTTLAEKKTALDKETQAAEEIQNKIEDEQEQCRKLKLTLEAGQNELRELENADVDAVRMQTQYEQVQKDAAELSGKDGIKSGVDAVLEDENTLVQEETKLLELAIAAADADNIHHQKYQAFISGQAGLMAVELEKELLLNESARCPVCHSELRADEAHDFAQYVDGTPTQAEVKEAERDRNEREKERAAQQSEVEIKKADLKSRKEALIARAKKLLQDCDSWETIVEDGYLDGVINRFGKAEKDAKDAYEEAKQKQGRKTELINNCGTFATELEALNRQINYDNAAMKEAELRAVSRRTEIKTIKSSLPFETLEEAQRTQEALGEEREALDARVKKHQGTLNDAKEAIDKAKGELTGKLKDLPEQKTAASTAKQDYYAALAANGFADEDAFTAALAPVGETDGEEWLTQQRESINAYQNDCRNTANRIFELTEQTKNLHYTDLEALVKELNEAGEQRDAVDREYNKQNNLLDNHRNVRKKASSALDELAKTNHAWRRLDKLADLALGAKNEGGKLSFERYVMGTIFKEVLDMANRRLDIMSGGRYSLVHSLSANRANSAAGLEIEVLDIATGKQRAASSLSGGESFQVSLSLALGLSDVVQSHAGGIGLDTLFIDEGFGALDGSALDNAITVLNQLTEGNRLVGIISHVDKLEESIPQKLRVKKAAKGSEVLSELS